jgi:hypothetical protein
MSVPVKRLTPCFDCPYRRESVAGWTGSNPPQWYVDSALADYTAYGLAPCHTSATEEKPLGTMACAGALIFAKNQCKSPRDPERAAAVAQVEQDRETVFDRPDDFLDHHTWEKTG